MTGPGAPMAFLDLLGRPMDGVTHIVLRHHRRSEFRWMGVLEMALIVLFFVCALPCIVVLALMGGGTPDGFDFGDGGSGKRKSRFTKYWHEIQLGFHGPNGQQLADVTHVPTGRGEGEAIVSAVLGAAAREGVVVVEALGAEVAEVWYGGRALLTHPEQIDVPGAIATLKRAGLEVEERDGTIVVHRHGEKASELGGWLRVVLFVVFFPLLITERGRTGLRDARMDATGVAPAEHLTTLHADRVEHRITRAGQTLDEHTLDLRNLIAVSFSATLGYENECPRYPPHLRLVGKHGTTELPFALPSETGAAFRDVLVGGLLHLRTLNPSAELPGLHIGATRCPFCATLFQLEPGVRCPSCGAWAGSFMSR